MSACGTSDGSSDTGDTDDPLAVVFVAGKTGPTAQLTADSVLGLSASMDELNDNGGILGRKVELTVVDNGSDPTRSVSELQKHIAKEGEPDMVVAGNTSADAASMLPLLTRLKIFSISTALSPDLNNPSEYPYNFQYLPTADRQQENLVNDFASVGAKSNVALFAANDAYGEAILTSVKAELEDADLEVDAVEFDIEDLDLSIAYEKAVAKKPEAIFVDTTGAPAHRVLEAREAIGATDIPLIIGPGMAATDGSPMAWATPKALENTYTQIFKAQLYVAPDKRSEGQKTFYQRIDDNGGVGKAGGIMLATRYDYALVWAAAVESAKTLDVEKVSTALEDGIDAPKQLMQWDELRFSSDNHAQTSTPDDTELIPRSEIVDGMYKPVK